MKRRTILLPSVALLVAVAVGAAVSIALVYLSSDGPDRHATAADNGTPASTAAVRPTAPNEAEATDLFGGPDTLSDALTQARNLFSSSPPFVSHNIRSMVYVETTYAQARQLLEFNPHKLRNRPEQDFANDRVVWVVMASGSFTYRGVESMPGPTYGVLWMVVAQGEPGLYFGHTSEELPLATLGKVEVVPGPLPEAPNPVRIAPE